MAGVATIQTLFFGYTMPTTLTLHCTGYRASQAPVANRGAQCQKTYVGGRRGAGSDRHKDAALNVRVGQVVEERVGLATCGVDRVRLTAHTAGRTIVRRFAEPLVAILLLGNLPEPHITKTQKKNKIAGERMSEMRRWSVVPTRLPQSGTQPATTAKQTRKAHNANATGMTTEQKNVRKTAPQPHQGKVELVGNFHAGDRKLPVDRLHAGKEQRDRQSKRVVELTDQHGQACSAGRIPDEGRQCQDAAGHAEPRPQRTHRTRRWPAPRVQKNKEIKRRSAKPHKQAVLAIKPTSVLPRSISATLTPPCARANTHSRTIHVRTQPALTDAQAQPHKPRARANLLLCQHKHGHGKAINGDNHKQARKTAAARCRVGHKLGGHLVDRHRRAHRLWREERKQPRKGIRLQCSTWTPLHRNEIKGKA